MTKIKVGSNLGDVFICPKNVFCTLGNKVMNPSVSELMLPKY